MLRIRDLGINAIPDRRAAAADGLFAESTCNCTDPSGKPCAPPSTPPCGPCTQQSGKPCLPCTTPSGGSANCPPDKKRALTHEGITQLQYQMRQKATAHNLSA
jgi:hypothetical protein